jgi:transposase-like protein
MMKKPRRKIDAALKAKIALEALREQATAADVAVRYEVDPHQIYAWKQQLLDNAARAFGPGVGIDAAQARYSNGRPSSAPVERAMEVVILMGIQGAGKSTFYRQRFSDTRVRINLDMLRTRHRERTLFQACLACDQDVVIDNTNPTGADRARYIGPAKAAGARIAGFYFSSRVSEATRRNVEREGVQRVPNKAILGTAGRLELPSLSEGFDALFYVSCTGPGEFSVEDWKDEVRRT